MGMTHEERRLLKGNGVLRTASAAPWPHAPSLERLAVKPLEAALMLGESRSTIYRLINAGHLDAVKRGSTTLVLTASIHRYLQSLPAFASRATTETASAA